MDITPRISPILPINAQAIHNLQIQAALENAQQVESEEDLSQYFETNPLQQAQRFRPLHELKNYLTEKKKESETVEEKQILAVEEAEDTAARFEQDNDELDARVLLILRNRLTGKVNADEIVEKTIETYADPALADEAIDFLVETATPEMRGEFQKAKQSLLNRYEMEIKAGRNMGAQARAFSKEGLGSPGGLRELYRDIIYNRREPVMLFNQLADKFPYTKLETAISFLLQSFGRDFRSKGPSISPVELQRLIEETRSLQGILGIYRFFQSRMALIKSHFQRAQLIVPPKLTFETLSRLFVTILMERYINPERILLTAKILGISEELLAQIVVYTQMRDALRQISPRYFRTPKHREELLKAFIDALEKLEDEQEEEEEEGKKDK